MESVKVLSHVFDMLKFSGRCGGVCVGFKHLDSELVLLVMQAKICCLAQSRSDSIKDGLGGISDVVTDVREIRNLFSYSEDF